MSHKPLSRRQFVVTSLAVGVLLSTAALSAAAYPTTENAAAPKVTRAGLDPALVQGRGASVPFVEQEAENAFTTGEKLGPSREAYSLPAEASGRTAVRLTSAGQYV